ncbi:MAG: BREX-2 system adenine-specific DNA-methyltransferase PglX, partial [Verrucomicrobiaceae bacterium]
MSTNRPFSRAGQTSLGDLVDPSPAAPSNPPPAADKPAKLTAADKAAAKAAKHQEAAAAKQAKLDLAAAKQEVAAAAKQAKEMAAAQKAPGKKAGKVQTLQQALSSFLEGPLVSDLTSRAVAPAIDRALRQQWEHERAAGRSAEHFEGFRHRIVLQIGASWVLCCVFVRTLEDRDMLERRRLAGEGADDSERLFFEQFPSLGHRDYLLAVFREVGKLPGAASVLGPGTAPAYRLSPSSDVARDLLKLFRRTDDATGALLYCFEGIDTRQIGDLYQDLSPEIRERYALLQTPDFVEEFILSRTLIPAINTFTLEKVRMLDPTCGSGHFLLGAFDILMERWPEHSPGLSAIEMARKALAQVNGVDLNPYAIAITRFRLTLAYMQAARLQKLRDIAKELPLNLVVADSLLVAAGQRKFGEISDEKHLWHAQMFNLEDPETAYRILTQGHHAVVGNPPYITPKDSRVRAEYAAKYSSSCFMNYALSVPFIERFFQLAVESGYIGMINANSFMKREFGKKIIENVLPRLHLSHVIDTSGAYIPGHGTPTVILLGRNQSPISDTVRGVLGKRGEPSTPDEPEKGHVWLSIAQHVDEPQFENDFVSVVDLKGSDLAKHPWSLGGGGASELKQLLEERASKKLSQVIDDVGFGVIIGEDELYLRPTGRTMRSDLPVIPLVTGEEIRDWSIQNMQVMIYPFDENLVSVSSKAVTQELWAYRAVLEKRVVSGSTTMKQSKRAWFDVRRLSRDKLRTPLSITFAFVATHNHFVLDRGGKVFKQSAPIIKLPPGATEDEHLALLGYLNSSTACFWMKQVCTPKGMHNGSESNSTPFLVRFEFSGTAMAPLPIPSWTPAQLEHLIGLTKACDDAQQQRAALSFGSIARNQGSIGGVVLKATQRREQLRELGIAFQEEIDWLVYEGLGLCTGTTTPLGSIGPLKDGERAFEIAMVRDGNPVAAEWGKWNESTLASEIPTRLPVAQAKAMAERLRVLASSPSLRLLESPENKRRWRQPSGKAAQELETDEKVLKDQALSWLVSSTEGVVQGREVITSLRSVVDECLKDSRLEEVASWLGSPEEAMTFMAGLIREECVPYLAPLRHTEVGMEKRRVWEETWDLQRREDAGEKLDVPVPPKYDSKDYRKTEYW